MCARLIHSIARPVVVHACADLACGASARCRRGSRHSSNLPGREPRAKAITTSTKCRLRVRWEVSSGHGLCSGSARSPHSRILTHESALLSTLGVVVSCNAESVVNARQRGCVCVCAYRHSFERSREIKFLTHSTSIGVIGWPIHD